MIDKGIGYAAGALTAPLGPEVAIPVSIAADAVSGWVGIGDSLAGPAIDGAVQAVGNGIENGEQQKANLSQGIGTAINRGKCLGMPDGAPGC